MLTQSAESQESQEFSTLAEVKIYLMNYGKDDPNVNITDDTASFTISILYRLRVNPNSLSDEDAIDLHYFMHNTIQYQYAGTNASTLDRKKFIINLLSTSDVSGLNEYASQAFTFLLKKLKKLGVNLDSLNNEALQISEDSQELAEEVSESTSAALNHYKAHSAGY